MSGIVLASVGNSYGALPINTDAPAISGTVSIGNALSCSTGTWTGAPAPAFTYQWQRGTSTNISGATSSSHTVVSADAGYTLRCVVTATNSLGVVSVATANTVAVSIDRAMGSVTTLTGYKTHNLQIVYDSTNEKVVATYIDANNSSYATARVGTVSSGSISWGTPVVFQSTEQNSGIAEGRNGTVYNSTAGKLVILFKNAPDSLIKSIVGTVSGNSITFGSVVTAISSVPSITQQTIMVSSTDSAKVVLYWPDSSNYNIKSRVGTISGTSISWGTVSTAHDNTTHDSMKMGAIWDSGQGKTVISYYDRGTYSAYSRVRVGTISGTTISHGPSRSTPLSIWSNPAGMAYSEASGKFLLAGGMGTCTVGTVSGTSVSFGSTYTFDTTGSAGSQVTRVTYNSATEDFIISFMDISDSYNGKVVDVSVSGTACSFSSLLDWYAITGHDMKYPQITWDGDTRQAILHTLDEAASPSYEGFTVVYTPEYP